MTDFILTVLYAVKEKYSKCFTYDIFTEEIKGNIAEYSGGDISAPEGGALLFVTDDKSVAYTAAAAKDGRTSIVYLGEYETVKAIYEKIDELWSEDGGEIVFLDRLKKYIRKMKSDFDLWFYRNTLITTITQFRICFGSSVLTVYICL